MKCVIVQTDKESISQDSFWYDLNMRKNSPLPAQSCYRWQRRWLPRHCGRKRRKFRYQSCLCPSETRSTGKIEVEGEDMSCYTHQTLFQQQLYNPDLKPLLYTPALSEVGFHRSHYLFSINSCQTLLSNVPPVNQSIAATHRNQDKVPLVITAKSKFNYLHIYPGQTASMHGRQGVWSVLQNVFGNQITSSVHALFSKLYLHKIPSTHLAPLCLLHRYKNILMWPQRSSTL